MSQRCQVTGAVPRFGKSASPSHRGTVRLRVSARGMRTIDRRGIEAVVAEIRARGEKI